MDQKNQDAKYTSEKDIIKEIISEKGYSFLSAESFFQYSILSNTSTKKSLLRAELNFDKNYNDLVKKKEKIRSSENSTASITEKRKLIEISNDFQKSKPVQYSELKSRKLVNKSDNLEIVRLLIDSVITEKEKHTNPKSKFQEFTGSPKPSTSFALQEESDHLNKISSKHSIITQTSKEKNSNNKIINAKPIKTDMLHSLLKIISKNDNISNSQSNSTTENEKLFNCDNGGSSSLKVANKDSIQPNTNYNFDKTSDYYNDQNAQNEVLSNARTNENKNKNKKIEKMSIQADILVAMQSALPDINSHESKLSSVQDSYYNSLKRKIATEQSEFHSCLLEKTIIEPDYISSDVLAENQAILNNADIVISEDALSSLFTTNQSSAFDFFIPIIAKNFNQAKPNAHECTKTVIFIDDPLEYKNLAKSESYLSYRILENLSSELLLDKNKKHFFSAGNEVDKSALVNSSADNFNYTLWQFGELRILIRFRVHGFITEITSSGKKLETTITFVPVIEPCVDLSPIIIPEIDRLKGYLKAYIRGQSKLAICHFNTDPNHHFNLNHVGVCTAEDLLSNVSGNELASAQDEISLQSLEPPAKSDLDLEIQQNEQPQRQSLATSYPISNFKTLYKLLKFIKTSADDEGLSSDISASHNRQFIFESRKSDFIACIYSKLHVEQPQIVHSTTSYDENQCKTLNIADLISIEPALDTCDENLEYDFKYSPIVWPKSINRVPFTFPTAEDL
ncbi:hypothetical protein AYI69_g4735 [Smittium culicis]|uniref:Uncharacterized protein n=1 Tax=Smittium culicis TaxID=133412 RepID=A0A1R1YB41_9FUNG|nr:hypothetical protein AYI69_g4735 [Smittium culicis]